jgi:hypothetical protein
VVRAERPGGDGEGPGIGEGGEAGDEVGAVGVVTEEGRSLDPPPYPMAQRVRGIQTGVARPDAEGPNQK